VVNTSGNAQKRDIAIDGVKSLQTTGKHIVLKSDNLDKVNTFENATAVSPVEQQINIKGKKVSVSLSPYSFNIIRVKML